jgi:hypothetical protein
MKRSRPDSTQVELFDGVWQPPRRPYRLRVNDLFRSEGKLCRVIRVSECAAVVLMNMPVRLFKTRFDREVMFRRPPTLFRISPNAEVQLLNRKETR